MRISRPRIWLATTLIATLAAMSGGAVAGAALRHGPHPDAEEVEEVVHNANSLTTSCGVERWSVKTGTDADKSLVNLSSVTSTTIASLTSLTAPATLPANNRIQPTETTVFRVQATLTEFKLEADSDYHLVLSDGSGHTMIAEIPDPACVGTGSVLTSQITNSRSEFDAEYTPTGTFHVVNVPVTVTGVGFFDFLHGQTGVAPNGIELHAVTDITFGGGSGGSVSVTNPGSQTGTVGTAVSLQIAANDSAGGTLSYTASGLPAGLSISSTTGRISGTPTASGTSSVTVTATDSTGPSGSASFTWTVNPGTGGCTAAQLFGNPGFETGTAAPWTASTGIINSDSASEPPHSGSWDTWLDGYGSAHTDTLAQTITLPSGCTTYQLSFWLHTDTAETTTSTAYDTLAVQVLNSSGTVLATLHTYSNLDHNTGYTQRNFDLSAYAGQSVTVKFTGTEDYTAQTSFVIDDTAVNVS
ncbi:putative Ig domain-containing protein [Catenulispora subtropica]|uniref:Dystroglycan-type cadherin-like domain-containing protein n=1 Tax=Catenulispora subtropica TaxID=450798 RepID=A0ABP5C3M2_9ACTN